MMHFGASLLLGDLVIECLHRLLENYSVMTDTVDYISLCQYIVTLCVWKYHHSTET